MRRDEQKFLEHEDLLIRAALGGSSEALGDLLVLHKPFVWSICNRILGVFRLGHWIDDAVQACYLEAVSSFHRWDPYRGAFVAHLSAICQTTCLIFVGKNQYKVEMRTVPPVDTDEDLPDEEFRTDPLDRFAYTAWERQSDGPPVVCTSAHVKHVIGRAAMAKKKAARKAREASKLKVRKKRDGRKIPIAQVIRVKKNRAAFVESGRPPAPPERSALQCIINELRK